MRFAPLASHWQRRRAMALPVALLFLALLFPGIAALSAAPPKARAHTVVIEAMQFSPATLEIKAGDTVTWRNKDPFPHNVSADNKRFRSGEIGSGQAWKFTARHQGVFTYVCTLHPGMRAVLVVK